MRQAEIKDRALVIKILSQSFNENKSINYVVKQDKNRKKRIDRLMGYAFDVCRAFGEVYISDDEKACVLIQLPHKKKLSLKAIWWDAKLGFTCIGLERAFKVLGRESKIKKHHPKTPFAYLWFIGVMKENQKSGVGSKLLNEAIQRYEKENLPIYLETSTLTNIPWYEKNGFKIINEIEFSYKLFILKREIKKHESKVLFRH